MRAEEAGIMARRGCVVQVFILGMKVEELLEE